MSIEADERIRAVFGWLDKKCRPVYAALYSEAAPIAAEELRKLHLELKKSGFPPELHELIEAKLRFLEYLMLKQSSPGKKAATLYKKLLSEFSEPSDNALISSMRNSLLLQLRTIDERDGGRAYPPREFHAHLKAIDAEMRINELEYYVAVWAYRHRDHALVEQALGRFTFKPGPLLGDFIWQHVNLMHQLLGNKASTRDVEEMIRRIDHPRLWTAVERTVWEDCEQLGLVNDDVQEMLEAKLSELKVDRGSQAGSSD